MKSLHRDRVLLVLGAVTTLALTGPPASAVDCHAPRPQTRVRRWAVVLGANVGTGSGLPDLSYADDDALAAYDLLKDDLGSEVVLLTDIDKATRSRVKDRYQGQARPPTIPHFEQAVKETLEAAARAKADGPVRVLVWIAAHGGPGGELYLSDGRLDRHDLRRILLAASAAADLDVDLVLDSCWPWAVFGRGTDNAALKRARAREQWASDLNRFPQVGVLLAETAQGEALEWTELASGIFSFIVRSALRGAADMNGDGRVTFSEIEGFGQIANNAIMDPRAHLQVRAVLPRQSEDRALVDWAEAPREPVKLRLPASGLRLRLWHPDTDVLMETNRGADDKPCNGTLLRLPARLDRLYVAVLGPGPMRRTSLPNVTDRELTPADFDDTRTLTAARGDARALALELGLFEQELTTPIFKFWTHNSGERWTVIDNATLAKLERRRAARRAWGWGLVGGAAVALGTGLGVHAASESAYDQWSNAARRGDVPEDMRLETKVRRLDLTSNIALGAAGALALAGAGILLWDWRYGTQGADGDDAVSLRLGDGLLLAGRF